MPEPTDDPIKTYGVSIPKSMYDALRALADQQDRPMSRVVRQAFREFLEREKHP